MRVQRALQLGAAELAEPERVVVGRKAALAVARTAAVKRRAAPVREPPAGLAALLR